MVVKGTGCPDSKPAIFSYKLHGHRQITVCSFLAWKMRQGEPPAHGIVMINRRVNTYKVSETAVTQ